MGFLIWPNINSLLLNLRLLGKFQDENIIYDYWTRYGGAERQVCDLADKYVQLGHRVLFVVLGGDVNNRPSEQSVAVMNLNMKKHH